MSSEAARPDRQSSGIDRSFAGLSFLSENAEDLCSRDQVIAGIDAAVEEAAAPEAARNAVIALLQQTMQTGRKRVTDYLHANPFAGLRTARSFAHVTDVLVDGVFHYCTVHLHAAAIRTKGQQLSVVAVGGYGRGEMAPFSDVDLLFLTPYKRTAWGESVVESMLYLLWDLKLKVGQAVRSIDECLRLGAEDLTIRTNLLEKRLICGDAEPFSALEERLWTNLFLKTGPEYVEAKLEERDRRHERNGGSRYLLEPNIKEGKGGLRDLQTLHWVSKYLYRSNTAWDLVPLGVFEQDEVQRFADAAKFLWAIRCHLHDLNGRAQEHLTFDRQVEIAERLGFEDGEGRRAVEHFMHAYFRHAKNVGDLTRIFSAVLEMQHTKAAPMLSNLLRAFSFKGVGGGSDGPFVVRDGRLTVAHDDVFEADPVNLIRLFHEAVRLDARIHPAAMRLVTQNVDLMDDATRRDPETVRLFLELLTDKSNAEWVLRRLNETDLLGRMIPEFGRIVAMMQFNMYHHYTVDEHTIQCIGILNRIERLETTEEHPVASEIIKGGVNQRVLYMALLLHDIGKGDARDHSDLGAELAAVICPRFGYDEAETRLVVWLVKHHLLMSDVAQKRDISDLRTIKDFAQIVKSPERLRLLLVLTVCDIRGVGPGVWNNWKAQLLRKLYWETRDFLTGDAASSREDRLEEAKAALAEQLSDWTAEDLSKEAERHYPHYWLGLDTSTHAIFAELARKAKPDAISSRFLQDPESDATKACLYMADHPGIFSRMAGALALVGAKIVDARTYTTADGMACSAFWIQDAEGKPFEQARLERLRRSIERTLKGEVVARDALRKKQRVRAREMSFTYPTRIVFDNDGSELYTVIEVNARDRLGLLYALTRTLTALNINIFQAIIATYGEHAVDVFYVKDLFGLKIRNPQKQALIEKRLKEAIDGIQPEIGTSGAA